MMKKSTRVAIVIAVVALLFSLFALPALAEGTETAQADTQLRDTLAWVIPLALLVIAIIVLAIVFLAVPKRREPTLKFFRGLKSEWNKISWFSWNQTWKGTLVVVVITLVLTVATFLLDLGFGLVIGTIGNLL